MDHLRLFFLFLAIAIVPYLGLTWAERRRGLTIPHRKIALATLALFFMPPFVIETVIVGIFVPPLIIVPMAFPASALVWSERLTKQPQLQRFITSVNVLISLIILGTIVAILLSGSFRPELRVGMLL